MKLHAIAAFSILLPISPALATDKPPDPAAAVKALVEIDAYRAIDLGPDAGSPAAVMFSPAFLADWREGWARAAAAKANLLDGDIITRGQSVKTLALRSVVPDAATAATANVTARISISDTDTLPASAMTVHFKLVRTGETWTVDDIQPADPANPSPSLRALMTR